MLEYSSELSGVLPSINKDYLITYLIYHLGWTALIGILILLLVFIIRGFHLCSRQKNIFGKLVSMSVLLTLSIQMIVYISSNLGFQLFGQIHFPSISYNGLATIVNFSLIGIMLSIFKSENLAYDNQADANSFNNKMIDFVDGKIIIDLGFNK